MWNESVPNSCNSRCLSNKLIESFQTACLVTIQHCRIHRETYLAIFRNFFNTYKFKQTPATGTTKYNVLKKYCHNSGNKLWFILPLSISKQSLNNVQRIRSSRKEERSESSKMLIEKDLLLQLPSIYLLSILEIDCRGRLSKKTKPCN